MITIQNRTYSGPDFGDQSQSANARTTIRLRSGSSQSVNTSVHTRTRRVTISACPDDVQLLLSDLNTLLGKEIYVSDHIGAYFGVLTDFGITRQARNQVTVGIDIIFIADSGFLLLPDGGYFLLPSGGRLRIRV